MAASSLSDECDGDHFLAGFPGGFPLKPYSQKKKQTHLGLGTRNLFAHDDDCSSF